LSLMKAIRGAIGTGGIFLLRADASGRRGSDAWLDRFVRRTNCGGTRPEWDQIWHHVATCDFPRPQPCGANSAAGRLAKCSKSADPTDFFQLSVSVASAQTAAAEYEETEALAPGRPGRPPDLRPGPPQFELCAAMGFARTPSKAINPYRCPTGMVYVEVNFMEH
jgi:hypothetical protein